MLQLPDWRPAHVDPYNQNFRAFLREMRDWNAAARTFTHSRRCWATLPAPRIMQQLNPPLGTFLLQFLGLFPRGLQSPVVVVVGLSIGSFVLCPLGDGGSGQRGGGGDGHLRVDHGHDGGSHARQHSWHREQGTRNRAQWVTSQGLRTAPSTTLT